MTQEAIELLNSPSLRREMGARGKKRAEAVFDWDVCLQKTLALYHQVLGNAR